VQIATDRRYSNRSIFGDLVLCVAIALVIACARKTEPVATTTSQERFHPHLDEGQIQRVNARVARETPCPNERQEYQWPAAISADPAAEFTKQVTRHGATDNSCGMLEIDRHVVDLAIQIAVRSGAVSESEVTAIKRNVDLQLFKPNTRTFVLMHNYDTKTVMDYAEPYLISEHHGTGRLVGMSISAARGIPRGNVGLLVFEDKVCPNDLSFSVVLPVLKDRKTDELVHCQEFIFAGQSNILQLIGAAYGHHLPASSEETEANVEPDAREWVSVAQLAVDIVKLLSAALK